MSQYFYKILDEEPPRSLPQKLPESQLDAQDGFIHLSTAMQIPITADLFFSTVGTIHLLKLRVRDLDGDIKYDEAVGPGCPHLHNSKNGLGKNNVVDVLTIQKEQYSTWAEVPALQELED
ncbi:hypothetical protein AMS68_000787 [Peltaster fructicola]|uniref:DUF952 domain-containing protein n=1 Tax=Peltaster fructicola TaxID=286661 RepID=A0A6H0XL93_9PEZI|nr:hypothetical protein AMS68_000787 [Peltaster fructicola]